MSEPRCDCHGPYTAEQAAALVCGKWKPEPTGHVCVACQEAVRVQAQAMAERIDADAMAFLLAASS
jgi:hypothetical protein